MGLRSVLDKTSIYTMYSQKPSLIYPSFTVHQKGLKIRPEAKELYPNFVIIGITDSGKCSCVTSEGT